MPQAARFAAHAREEVRQFHHETRRQTNQGRPWSAFTVAPDFFPMCRAQTGERRRKQQRPHAVKHEADFKSSGTLSSRYRGAATLR
jgi:hypothetical protein